MNRRPANGFVLVTVLWILAILTLVTVSFGHHALLHRRAAAFSLDHLQALYMARGAAQRGMVELRNKAFIDRLLGQAGRTSFDQRWFDPPDMFNEDKAFSLGKQIEVKDEQCRYIIRDAEGLISVNHARREVLDQIEGLSFRTVDLIFMRRGGALSIQRPQPFLAAEELSYLKGVDDAIWYGDEGEPGLRDLVTVWGDHGRININTCSQAVLECIPDLDDEVILGIVAYRAGSDGKLGTSDDAAFVSLSDLPKKLPVAPDRLESIQRYCKLDSSFFTITGFATQRQGKVRAQCTAAVKVDGESVVLLDWREDVVGP